MKRIKVVFLSLAGLLLSVPLLLGLLRRILQSRFGFRNGKSIRSPLVFLERAASGQAHIRNGSFSL